MSDVSIKRSQTTVPKDKFVLPIRLVKDIFFRTLMSKSWTITSKWNITNTTSFEKLKVQSILLLTVPMAGRSQCADTFGQSRTHTWM